MRKDEIVGEKFSMREIDVDPIIQRINAVRRISEIEIGVVPPHMVGDPFHLPLDMKVANQKSILSLLTFSPF